MVRESFPAITLWLCLRTLNPKSPPTKNADKTTITKTGGQARQQKPADKTATVKPECKPKHAADLKVQRIIVKKQVLCSHKYYKLLPLKSDRYAEKKEIIGETKTTIDNFNVLGLIIN